MPLTSTLGKQRQEKVDLFKFETSQVYTVGSRKNHSYIVRPGLKKRVYVGERGSQPIMLLKQLLFHVIASCKKKKKKPKMYQ